jgi:hypothetical protein
MTDSFQDGCAIRAKLKDTRFYFADAAATGWMRLY